MACLAPAPGTRLMLETSAGRFTGTIGYVGPIEGSNGVWIGVDWDDPKRGKHDGTHNDIRYFSCRLRNSQSASFIRPSISGLSYGKPFLEALNEKYIDHTLVEEGKVEQVVLGSSQGAILVEAPKLSQVRQRLSNLGKLRFVSLDGEGVCSSGGIGSIRGRLDNVIHLDLSCSLIPTWEEILIITSQLPKLQTLLLNHNRLIIKDSLSHEFSPCPQLQELHLNDTLITQVELSYVQSWFPNLRGLQLGKNFIQTLNIAGSSGYRLLEELNLDSNVINDWTMLMLVLRNLPALRCLLVPRNEINAVNYPGSNDISSTNFTNVKQLSLSENQISDWHSIDALAVWLRNLEDLSIQDNPITSPAVKHYRPLIIARIPSLVVLNGSLISQNERKDSELFYLADIVRTPDDPAMRTQNHPQWRHLIEKYGAPDETRRAAVTDTLAGRTFELFVQKLGRVPIRERGEVSKTPLFSVKVLPSMTPKMLRLKIVKLGKIKKNSTVRLWAILQDRDSTASSDAVMREMDDPSKPLEYWGLDSGCGIGFLIDR
ncbi:hypothetical protein FRC02_000083 [Tulasnella sp. 418]|nr:hypothetical protein FRC02_000083 [Tulasnella sp. 418]